MEERENVITRRRFVGAAGAAALAASAPAASAKKHKRKMRHADVVVVGAGLAGLTAARRIVHAGHSAIVLEARHRVGGRVWNHNLGNGHVSERGATFVGPTQNRVLAMMSELGIGKFDTFEDGDNIYVIDGARGTWRDTGPTGSAPSYVPILPELALTVQQVDQMSATVPVDAPWSAPNAAALDAQTFETWLKANSVTQTFRDLVPVAFRPIFGAEMRELSLLFVLFYVAASGDEQNPGTFERNFNTRAGGQMWRVVGGSQAIPKKMAHGLHKRLILGSPVRQITQTSSGVRVRSDRAIVRAKRAIVAIPPILAGDIRYHPAMPSGRHHLTQRYPMGNLTKVAAVYDRPFWRDAGLNGQAVSTGGPVTATFDDSPVDGSLGIVFGFVGGDYARAYKAMSRSARRAAVLRQFADYFGPKALHPRDFFETIWTNEKWSRGCPVGLLAPGTLTAYGPHIRQPVGHIHWAGTETSTYWNGYMDGAVRSGERAAAEVLAQL